jgi:hypothetical protein
MYRLFTAFFLCATFVPAQEISPDQGTVPPPEIPVSVKARLAALLPDAVDAAIKPSGTPQFYSSDLWQYMDGGADVYLNYGLTAMVHREYKGTGLEITVDIFDMGQPLNAFGIYAAERSSDYHFMAIGAEGYSGDFLLNFLQDRFYIKFSGFGDPAKAAPVLERLARFVSERTRRCPRFSACSRNRTWWRTRRNTWRRRRSATISSRPPCRRLIHSTARRLWCCSRSPATLRTPPIAPLCCMATT